MMKSFKAYLDCLERMKTGDVVVTFSNIKSLSLLLENYELIEEGKRTDWKKGYTYRLDKRPNNQGGDQLHIFDRKGKSWAYRHNGQKSEPNKYKFPPTNLVKDIVSDIFKIDPSKIEEKIIQVSGEKLLVEINLLGIE